MRISEYKQISTEVIENNILVDDVNEDGEVIGQHEETIRKEVPVMGTVYRDMTEEEVAEYEKSIAELPPPQPTLEDKVNALMSYMGLTGKWNGSVFEVVKEEMPIGDYVNPIPFTEGMTVEVGKFYKFADDNIWECIKSGNGSYTSEYFDIIN